MTDDDLPMNLEDAETERSKIIEEKNSIQAQLANRNLVVDGKRVGGSDYHHWRRQVVERQAELESRLARIKDFIRQEKNAEKESQYSESDAHAFGKLRDDMAKTALRAMLCAPGNAGDDWRASATFAAAEAYRFADAMLDERERIGGDSQREGVRG